MFHFLARLWGGQVFNGLEIRLAAVALSVGIIACSETAESIATPDTFEASVTEYASSASAYTGNSFPDQPQAIPASSAAGDISNGMEISPGMETPANPISSSSSNTTSYSSADTVKNFSADTNSALPNTYTTPSGDTPSALWVTPPGNPLPDNGVPYLRITMADTSTMDSAVYSPCAIEIAGNGMYESLPASNAKIRLRGNSTRLWYDKKPYRIKFETKTPVLGLDANKDWVLLANYRDQSKFMNAIAFDMARYMGNFAFVNANRFVEVEINGDYKGMYQLTEQIERANSRVNFGTGGVLLSLDQDDGPELSPGATNNFWSKVYKLPVAIKYPKNLSTEQVETIAQEFSILEQAIADTNYAQMQQLLDVKSFIDFILLQEITRNVELEAPRSMYLYRDDAGIYHFGPVWDFDGGFGYSWDEDTKEYFSSNSWILGSANPATSPFNCTADKQNDWGMCATGNETGGRNDPWGGFGGNYGGGFGQSNYDGNAVSGFFVNMFANADFLNAYKARFAELQAGILDDAFAKLDAYVTSTRMALDNDAVRWPPVRPYASEIQSLKQWLTERVSQYAGVVQGY